MPALAILVLHLLVVRSAVETVARLAEAAVAGQISGLMVEAGNSQATRAFLRGSAADRLRVLLDRVALLAHHRVARLEHLAVVQQVVVADRRSVGCRHHHGRLEPLALRPSESGSGRWRAGVS